MLDINYLGEVNNPDGLPGLHDQSSLGTWYVDAIIPGWERGRELQSTAVSSQFTTMLFLKHVPTYTPRMAADCKGSESETLTVRAVTRDLVPHEDSFCILPRTHFTRARSRRARSLYLVARLCSRERERCIK
eukprot:6049449-Pleurochrysis_carterae.AAC.2